MKRAWDQLMDDYKESRTWVVADVDCTRAGKSLCAQFKIQSFPTIKHGHHKGDDLQMEDYAGGRDYESLKKFLYGKGPALPKVEQVPTCGPANPDLCNLVEKEDMETFSKESTSELEAHIRDKEGALEKIRRDFKKFQDDLKERLRVATKKKDKGKITDKKLLEFEAVLEDQYKVKETKRDRDIADQSRGLDLMKNVAAYKKSKSEL